MSKHTEGDGSKIKSASINLDPLRKKNTRKQNEQADEIQRSLAEHNRFYKACGGCSSSTSSVTPASVKLTALHSFRMLKGEIALETSDSDKQQSYTTDIISLCSRSKILGYVPFLMEDTAAT